MLATREQPRLRDFWDLAQPWTSCGDYYTVSSKASSYTQMHHVTCNCENVFPLQFCKIGLYQIARMTTSCEHKNFLVWRYIGILKLCFSYLESYFYSLFHFAHLDRVHPIILLLSNIISDLFPRWTCEISPWDL